MGGGGGDMFDLEVCLKERPTAYSEQFQTLGNMYNPLPLPPSTCLAAHREKILFWRCVEMSSFTFFLIQALNSTDYAIQLLHIF
jgi:hypothetical protein